MALLNSRHTRRTSGRPVTTLPSGSRATWGGDLLAPVRFCSFLYIAQKSLESPCRSSMSWKSLSSSTCLRLATPACTALLARRNCLLALVFSSSLASQSATTAFMMSSATAR